MNDGASGYATVDLHGGSEPRTDGQRSSVPRTIAFVLPSFAAGGAERVTVNLLAGLDPTCFRARLVILDSEGPLRRDVPEKIPVHDLHRRRLRGGAAPLVATLRQMQPELIFSSLGHINLLLLAARGLLGRSRLILREANLPSVNLRAEPYRWLQPALFRLLYRRADLVLASSQRMAAELENQFRVPPARIRILANPVDERGIRAQLGSPRRASARGACFVAAGRLVVQKGFDRLLDAMTEVDPEAHLTILGEGPERQALESRVRSSGLAERVQLAGFKESPWDWYAGADAFLLPSRWEGTPNAALEALACGTPVIASAAAGGLAEAVEAAAPGAISIAATRPKLAAAMNAVVPHRKGKAASSLLPEYFRLGEVLSRFQDLLREAG